LDDGAIYNIEDGGWKEMAEAPIDGRWGHTSVLYGKRLVIWGGCAGGAAWDDGAIYDIEKDSWVELPEPPIKGRAFHTSVLIGEKLIIWGGAPNSGDIDNTFDDGAIYDLGSGKWEKMPKAVIDGRAYHTAIVWDKRLIIWGGLGASVAFNDGAIYDVEKNKWEEIPEPPENIIQPAGRGCHSCVLLGDKLIIWGGMDLMPGADRILRGNELVGGTYYSNGAIYDLVGRRWEELPKAPLRARGAHSVLLWGKKMIIWGGWRGSNRSVCDGAIYDTEKGEWEEMPDPDIIGRYGHTFILFEDKKNR
jgi:N-acetylneuraminic acid mutarotase